MNPTIFALLMLPSIPVFATTGERLTAPTKTYEQVRTCQYVGLEFPDTGEINEVKISGYQTRVVLEQRLTDDRGRVYSRKTYKSWSVCE